MTEPLMFVWLVTLGGLIYEDGGECSGMVLMSGEVTASTSDNARDIAIEEVGHLLPDRFEVEVSLLGVSA